MSRLDEEYCTRIALEAVLIAIAETPIIASMRRRLKEAAALRRQLARVA